MIMKINDTTAAATPKYRQVFDYLAEAIEAGVFVPDRRMPSERRLAEELAVNVATVRRAFRDLIAGGIVEKRVGDGTYVLPRPVWESENRVNLILSNYEGSVQRELAKLMVEESRRGGFQCRIFYAGMVDWVMQLRTFIQFRQPTVILGDTLVGPEAIREMAKTPELFVVIANRLDHLGIPSVCGNDYTGIAMLVDHLRSRGHSRIGLVYNNTGLPGRKHRGRGLEVLLSGSVGSQAGVSRQRPSRRASRRVRLQLRTAQSVRQRGYRADYAG